MNIGKKTKIVCTVGPSTASDQKIQQLIEAGMNVMRLNFSHGDWDGHQEMVYRVRSAMQKTGKMIAILQDLSGPKIRIGTFKGGKILLEEGKRFILTTDDIQGDSLRVNVNYANLPKEVKPGSPIMLQDGTKKLEVIEVKGNDIITKVIVGGPLGDRRGVNVPGANLSISSLTEKDKKDVQFGIKNKVDFVALSFVRKAQDIIDLREILVKGGSNAHIIAKIETPEALQNLDEIIKVTDGVMIARGDLAIEIPAEEVPIVQKLIINKCNSVGKPVITATQMLESMVKSPVPTRAEVSDVANAIIDGTDAIMLSEETALGEYPIEAVKVMTKVAERIENEVFTMDTIAEYEESHGVTDVVSQSAVRAAHNVGASLIVAMTRRGRVPRMIARYRPAEPILVLSDREEHLGKLMLTYGCYPLLTPTFKTMDEIICNVREATLGNKLLNKGDKVVIVGGNPIGSAPETNFILVETL